MREVRAAENHKPSLITHRTVDLVHLLLVLSRRGVARSHIWDVDALTLKKLDEAVCSLNKSRARSTKFDESVGTPGILQANSSPTAPLDSFLKNKWSPKPTVCGQAQEAT